ncbi:MAG: hypothetical protein R3A52_11285 [Polyangiales bacterium]
MALSIGPGCTSEPELPSGQCLYDSNCADGQVCVSFYCRQPCQADRDCGTNGRCVRTGDRSVCATEGQPSPCAYSTDCPEGNVCTREGTCQPQCRTDYDCEVANPYQRCRDGVCGLFCERPRLDCDRDVRNGCETDVRTSVDHCGACDNRCAAGPHQVAACADGACAPRCEAGWADCNDDPSDGCEADLSLPAHCGACGNACPSSAPRCARATDGPSGATAYTCALVCDGETPATCGPTCANLQTDARNCGACGNACPSGPNSEARCVDGRCAVACSDATHADCDADGATGCEVELPRDPTHCGACGVTCPGADNASAVCAEGACGVACADGFGNCDGAPGNGCEVDLRDTVTACGACGNACAAAPNARAVCAAGRCAIACNEGYGDCDGDATNGCETDLTTAATHCGACGNACPMAGNGAPTCSAGRCAITCSQGFADCDGSAANGCEANLGTTVDHCGRCGNRCAVSNGTPACAAGACAVATCATGYADCDGDAGNGCETDTRTNAANCGACGNVCRFDGAGARCAAGVCERTSCAAGLGDCDGNAANGCETTLATSAANCGACGNVCRLANATARCAAGACAVAACAAGFADCDGNPANGCETDTRVTVSSCGACGAACSAVNGTPSCSGGACAIACSAGFGNCDGNVANGCETNTASTVAHCGACGRACAPPHATGGCSASRCVVAACDAGWADCNGNPADGCETNLQTSVSSCGRCGAACSANHGTPSCAAGACGIACATGYGDCNGVVSDGCETPLATTPAHCGMCGRACSLPNATAGCAAGACTVAACAAGFGDCDGNAANGCETNLGTTPSSCGACGNVCRLANATAGCAAGACTVTACASGYGNCDGAAANGCETPLATTPAHCGACGRACSLPNATAGCAGGACTVAACATGWGNCDGAAANGCETNTTNSTAHCGACGNACPTGQVCSGSRCTNICAAPTTFCSGSCVNLDTDPANCGRCGGACPTPPNASPVCVSRACGGVCRSGYADCNASMSDGCEVNVTSDVANCGACGAACRPPNATGVCAGGLCGVASCASGYGDCNRVASDGCEVNLGASPANCGACGNACAYANGSGGCRGGACYLAACNAGWGNCDQNASNGCETNLNTTPTSCGACGSVCSLPNATAGCAGGACTVASCASGYGDCDGNAANGCETSLSSLASCGACGRACSHANAFSLCLAGSCSLARCFAGYANCDGSLGNGCETSTTADNNNCGACGNVCGAGTTCVNSACRPTNDTCGGATTLTLSSPHINVPFNTVNATHNTDAPAPCTSVGQGDVFFRFTLTQREVVVADTFGVGFDTTLFFASGTACTAYSRIRISGAVWCNDDAGLSEQSGGPGCTGVTNASQVAGLFEPGTYYLVVSNTGTASGTGTVHFEHLPVTTVGGVYYLPQATTGAQFYNRYYFPPTAGSISTICGAGGRGPEHSFWWRTCPAQAARAFTASTCFGANTELRDTVLELRHGTGAGTFCNDDVGTACSVSTASSINATLPAGAGLHTLDFDLYSTPTAGVYSSVIINAVIIGDARAPLAPARRLFTPAPARPASFSAGAERQSI